MTQQERLAYSIREAAAVLGVSGDLLLREIRAGRVPAKRLGGRWIVPARALRAWLDGETVMNGKDE